MATAKPVRSKATSSTQANENQLQGRIFASYVPPASFMDSNIQGMAVSEKYSSRFPETNMFEGMRIVIEPNPKKPGDYIFTTIPMAELGPGIEDEGEWPRFVSFIGLVELFCLSNHDALCALTPPPSLPLSSQSGSGKRNVTNFSSLVRLLLCHINNGLVTNATHYTNVR